MSGALSLNPLSLGGSRMPETLVRAGTRTGESPRAVTGSASQPSSGFSVSDRASESDSVQFSPESLQKAGLAGQQDAEKDGGGKGLQAGQDLTDEEKKQVQDLQKRDREVRDHEQAHLSAAGGYARGGANFSFTTGPDGKRYATGGDVSIDMGAERTPEATIRKMEVVKRAAMAPAQPSSQDRAVHAAATKTEQSARQELTKQNTAEAGSGGAASKEPGTADGPTANKPAPSTPETVSPAQRESAAGENQARRKPGMEGDNATVLSGGISIQDDVKKGADQGSIRSILPGGGNGAASLVEGISKGGGKSSRALDSILAPSNSSQKMTPPSASSGRLDLKV